MRRISVCGLLLWLFLVLPGCGGPVLSQSVIQQSDPNAMFQDIIPNPEKYVGNMVILGGTIIAVENSESGSWLEVLQRPLGYRMKPQLDDRTFGRFILKSDKFLDDQIFVKGRSITVAAEVIGSETRPLGKITYDYPLLRLQEYYLWSTGERYLPRFHFGVGVNTGF